MEFSPIFFTRIFAIANVPFFICMVNGATHATKESINRKATIMALVTIVVFVVFVVLGKFIFELLGITIPAFKITGGILVFYVGFEMLQSKNLR